MLSHFHNYHEKSLKQNFCRVSINFPSAFDPESQNILPSTQLVSSTRWDVLFFKRFAALNLSDPLASVDLSMILAIV